MIEKPRSFDELYASYNNYYLKPSDGLIDCVNQYVHQPCRALDLGCGQGRNAIWLALNGFDVLAIDISEKAIEFLNMEIKRKKIKIQTVLADAVRYNFGVSQFGLIVIQTTLNHLDSQNISNCCEKMIASLKPDGVLYCVGFTIDDPGYTGQMKLSSECKNLVKYYFMHGELHNLFSELEILYYKEYIKEDSSHGPKHIHGKAKLIGRKK